MARKDKGGAAVAEQPGIEEARAAMRSAAIVSPEATDAPADMQMWSVHLPPYIRIDIAAVSRDDAIAKYRERTGIRRQDLIPTAVLKG